MPSATSQLFLALLDHPVLRDVTLNGILTFSRLIGALKHNILQLQPLFDSDIEKAPQFLGPAIHGFIAAALGIDDDAMGDLWSLAKDYVWELPQ
jgi:hypothetical protein